MNNFTENTRVQVPAALHLCKLGYTYLDNIIDYEENTNILTDVFISSLKRLNPEITDLECLQLLNKIKQIANTPPSSSDIAEKIKSFSTTGIFVGMPSPSPSPNHPPVPIPNND